MKTRILEIGPYPPPDTGWSVRIKHLKVALENEGHDCKVLNIGRTRKIRSNEYIDVQNSLDYVRKLVRYRLQGYRFHVHGNAQAVKGPILTFTALLIAFLTFRRAALTFHGGAEQLYFPRERGGKMYWVLYLNFLLPSTIICNHESIKDDIARYGPGINCDKIHPIPAFSVQYLNYNATTLPEEVEAFMQSKKRCIACYLALRNGFFVETAIEFFRRLAPDTGVVLTGVGKVEDDEVAEAAGQLENLQAQGKIHLVDNLDHDQFMTLLKRCDIYLRTPESDGISSSVLEALSLAVPVVASENHRRPAGVITYKADDVEELDRTVSHVLKNLGDIKRHISVPAMRDTVRDEVGVLVGQRRQAQRSVEPQLRGSIGESEVAR